MKQFLKMHLSYLMVCVFAVQAAFAERTDTIPSGFSRMPSWRVGAEVNPSIVPRTNRFLKGVNEEKKNISYGFSGDLRTDFSFAPDTKEGVLYRDLYQGVGVGVNSFFAHSLLGTPVSVYVYQGAPFVHFSRRFWLGYEWRFGAAFGWRHNDEEAPENYAPMSTAVTAMLGLGIKLHYAVSDHWQLSLGINGTHYSNGNTSWPNSGVNSVGATLGIAYMLNPKPWQRSEALSQLSAEANKGRWLYDIMIYGAWRKRIIKVEYEPQICPGRFGIVGLQFSPLRKLNRYVAVGPALDMQWDEGAGIEQYWISGTTGSDIKFERPPFGKQLSIGVSAHAELTMPIFSVNAGIGYNFLCPFSEGRLYQSLTLKAFLTQNLFLNVGYRIGNFKDPQNLMLGIGVRL